MNKLYILLFGFTLFGCSSGPEPISYGQDGCHFCKMTIVDNKFGAEIVTDKGKVFKFDAVECMVNYSKNNPLSEKDYAYSIDFLSGNWINADMAFYLRSKNIPSPMGQYITALPNRNSADSLKLISNGVVQSWEELKNNFEITKLE